MPDTDSLFRAYFRADSLPVDYPMYLAEAFLDYQDHKYRKLVALELARLPDEVRSIDDDSVNRVIAETGRYYQAIACLATGATEKAKENLEWVIKNSSKEILRDKARWYLGLYYIKSGDLNSAKTILKKLNSESQYFKKAQEVKNKITL
jgi:tetratricopeptide (TPR) repeat protein